MLQKLTLDPDYIMHVCMKTKQTHLVALEKFSLLRAFLCFRLVFLSQLDYCHLILL